ncbi:MAG TPA: 50S ribosomal protein L21 [Gammaproteobacteria bacterium]|nr:50S ribosomal protein L21 [Gammaproteobacteria bacterium]
MYAVIETGGKQYRVSEGDLIRCEQLAAEAGAAVTFDRVLMVGRDQQAPLLGTPYVAGGKVTGTVKSLGRGDKIFIFKMRRRKNYRRRAGHRQHYTEVQITGIHAG